MKKLINFGRIAYDSVKKVNLVTIEMNLKENSKGKPVFSASANVWNNKIDKDIVLGGQCIDTIYNEFRDQLSDISLYEEIMCLWSRNHLNDMNAGTIEQETAIKAWIKSGNKYDYEKVCQYLKSIDLYEVEYGDLMYRYGSGWIYRDISENDLKRIKEIMS